MKFKNSFYKKALQTNPRLIQDIENPTEEFQLIAVKSAGLVIQFIKNPSINVQLAAINKAGTSIQFIDNPCEIVQHSAIKNRPTNISLITDPLKSTQIEFAKIIAKHNTIYNCKHINLCEEAQLIILRRDIAAVKFLSNPTYTSLEYAINTCPHIIFNIKSKFLCTKLWLIAGSKNKDILHLVPNCQMTSEIELLRKIS